MTPVDMLAQCPVPLPALGVWRELSGVTSSPSRPDLGPPKHLFVSMFDKFQDLSFLCSGLATHIQGSRGDIYECVT